MRGFFHKNMIRSLAFVFVVFFTASLPGPDLAHINISPIQVSCARAGLTPLSSQPAAQPDAHAILKKIDDLWRGTSSKAILTMKVKTIHWERTLTMEAWSQGTEKTLVKVIKPLKERGIATLKVKNEIYNYLPKTDRSIKLTAAMMMGSWMGSHFTNDDLVKESRMSEDYDPSITFSGKREGADIIELTLTPKPEAPVVWGKLIVIVRSNDLQPVRITYYDEDMIKAREMTFSDYKVASGRMVPMRMIMRPTDKPTEFTEIIYNELVFDITIPEGFFSLAQLRH